MLLDSRSEYVQFFRTFSELTVDFFKASLSHFGMHLFEMLHLIARVLPHPDLVGCFSLEDGAMKHTRHLPLSPEKLRTTFNFQFTMRGLFCFQ